MFYFMNIVHSFMNCAIFRELCDRMRFEVDCAKSHHRLISEGLYFANFICNAYLLAIIFINIFAAWWGYMKGSTSSLFILHGIHDTV